MREWLVNLLLGWATALEWPGESQHVIERHYEGGRRSITIYTGRRRSTDFTVSSAGTAQKEN